MEVEEEEVVVGVVVAPPPHHHHFSCFSYSSAGSSSDLDVDPTYHRLLH